MFENNIIVIYSRRVVWYGILCRMWDLEKDENYVLGLGMKSSDIVDPSETITCIAYSSAKGDSFMSSMRSEACSCWRRDTHVRVLCVQDIQ